MTEDKAIQLCLKKQDPHGFDYLVRKFRREAYFHAYSLLQNDSDAADACQESFASAFANMPKLSKLDKFYPWFYRILRNRCLNILSRRKTRETNAKTVQEYSQLASEKLQHLHQCCKLRKIKSKYISYCNHSKKCIEKF